VRPVDNVKEAKAAYDDVIGYSGNEKIIIEEYIRGPELSVNAFVIDGDAIFFQESDRISFDEYPGGIIKEHRIPSRFTFKDEVLRSKIHKMTQKAVNKLSIDNGPAYIQLKLDKEKDPKIIEFTPRLDGCHIWRLINFYSGADILDATFRLLFGHKKKAKETLERVDKGEEYILKFLVEKPNNIVNKEKYDLSESLFSDWYYNQGDKVREINGFIERVGYQIVRVKR
ncbi:MAG: ATP-grasp domain-containing protein, partial [Thermoplasmatota archaeon]